MSPIFTALRVWTTSPPLSQIVSVNSPFTTGDDATLSEFAAASIGLSVPFLPVPCGFGNLFTSAFEHPREPEEVVDLLGRGDFLWANVGVAKSGTFLSHPSFGFLARIQ